MIWSQIADAKVRMSRARRKLMENPNAQFWGVIGLSMGLVEVPGLGTMATNAKSIFYDPDLVLSMSEDECQTMIAHEISHSALDHFRRQGDREQEDWNIAADYELNLDLAKAGFAIAKPDYLLDRRFDGMPAEQIYSVVRKENAKAEREGTPKPHQSRSKSGDMQAPSNDDGTPMSGDDKAKLAEQWSERVAQTLGAARKAGKMADGDVPASLVSVSGHVNASSFIDWRQPLRAFIDNLGSRYSTFAKFSRRGLSRGQYLPGQRVIRPSLIGWMIDVSGSMDAEKNRQALTEAQAALDDLACDAIELVYVDTQIRGTERYEIGDTIPLRDDTGGETSFESAMAWAAEQDYAAIVFVTDGQTSAWGTDPSIPVLWAVTDSQRATDGLMPPYGDKLCLYTS